MKKYRHYGAEKYDPTKFKAIMNRRNFTKPYGGLWASEVQAESSWKDWCEGESFALDTLDKHFDFILREDARVLRFEDSWQAKLFKKDCPVFLRHENPFETAMILDFELLAKHYDAVEINAGSNADLYQLFYSWDCDSILILNQDIIIPLQEHEMDKVMDIWVDYVRGLEDFDHMTQEDVLRGYIKCLENKIRELSKGGNS